MGLLSYLGRLFRVTPPVDPRIQAARDSVQEFLEINPNPCISLQEPSPHKITLFHTPHEGEDAVITRMRALDTAFGLTIVMDYGTAAQMQSSMKSDIELPHASENQISLSTLEQALRIFCTFGPDMRREEPFDLLDRVRTPRRAGGPGLKM